MVVMGAYVVFKLWVYICDKERVRGSKAAFFILMTTLTTQLNLLYLLPIQLQHSGEHQQEYSCP